MPSIKSAITVNLPVKVIYDALADVESYPRIFSYIKSAKILERAENTFVAEIKIGVGFLAITYRCRIWLDLYKTITIEAISGPFQYLKSNLEFTSISAQKTKIKYSLDSKFKSQALESAAALVFTRQFKSSLKTFENHVLNLPRG